MSDESEPIFPQSAVIPWRRRDETIEVAMITSASGNRWVFPKGLIDPGEFAESSALREAEEEAGLRGVVHGPALGRYEYRKWGGICRVEVFLMRVDRVLDDWPEKRMRQREWITLDEAMGRVDEPDLKQLLEIAPAIIDGITEGEPP